MANSLADTWEEEYELRSKLSNISNELQLNYKISLIFLMFESPNSALKAIRLLLDDSDISSKNNGFFNWLINHNIFKKKEWKETFSEYLTIIQNFKLVKELGYEKNEAKVKYLPKNNFKTFFVSGIRKLLYNLCEELNQKNFEKFTTLIDNTYNIPLNNENDVGLEYLEYRLLIWNENNLININENQNVNLDAIILVLRSLEYVNLALDMEILVQQKNCQLLRNNTLAKSLICQSEFYPVIDESNIGFCVIINEKVFSNSDFTTRWGTEKDVERLVEVFSNFGFIIKVHSDLTYDELIKTLEYYTKAVEKSHSAFVLIVLSHGSENVIYTSDSQPVDMNTIEMVFQAELCPNLIGKPKIFIVQSCQGQKWQKLCAKRKEFDIFCDSTISSENCREIIKGPQRGDSMIAWSTVQGFASFRDKFNGSWYIQELCNELWRFGDVSDLVEIFTRVNNNLRSKVYDNQFMVPSLLLSLRAKVKFSFLPSNELKAKKLILERLVFEKNFREFLENSSLYEIIKVIKR